MAQGIETKYHIRFFPEGGDPVEGTLCRIAFKASDENGIPIKVEGEVLNSDKIVIAKLNTIHDGMGSFSLTGYAGKNNIAMVRFPDQSVQTVTLPEFKKNGIGLKVKILPKDTIEVSLSAGNNPALYHNVVLAAFQDNGFIATYGLQLNSGVNIVMLKKSEFSTGILRLTVFGEQGAPLAERIVFINNYDQLNLSLRADSLSLDPRGKSVFKLNAATSGGKTIAGNFSLSVTDADASEISEEDNILSSLLMSSELMGKVYHPAYYFENNSDTLQQQLDLVMLTNG